MCTDNVIRKFFRLLSTEPTFAAAARKAGISEKTARKYRRARRLPSARATGVACLLLDGCSDPMLCTAQADLIQEAIHAPSLPLKNRYLHL